MLHVFVVEKSLIDIRVNLESKPLIGRARYINIFLHTARRPHYRLPSRLEQYGYLAVFRVLDKSGV